MNMCSPKFKKKIYNQPKKEILRYKSNKTSTGLICDKLQKSV